MGGIEVLGKDIVRLVLVVLFINASSLGAAESNDPGASPEAGIYEQALTAFVKEIDGTYPFLDLKGIRGDWDLCKKDLLQEVRQCRSNTDFYALLGQAHRCLRDPHIRFANLKGEYPQPEKKYYPGVSFLPAVDEQVVVVSSTRDYASSLKPGTVVKEIDGKNARDYLQHQTKESWKAGGYFSSPQRAELYIYRIPLKGKKGDIHRLTIVSSCCGNEFM